MLGAGGGAALTGEGFAAAAEAGRGGGAAATLKPGPEGKGLAGAARNLVMMSVFRAAGRATLAEAKDLCTTARAGAGAAALGFAALAAGAVALPLDFGKGCAALAAFPLFRLLLIPTCFCRS